MSLPDVGCYSAMDRRFEWSAVGHDRPTGLSVMVLWRYWSMVGVAMVWLLAIGLTPPDLLHLRRRPAFGLLLIPIFIILVG